MIKRGFDVLVAVAALVVTAPLMLVIAVLIRLEDRGPALLRQSRVGLDGEDFELFKFRTMVPDAHALGTGWLIAEHDPRITRVGKVLRKWSLDELPQVFNVLRGDMSIVGPRPTLRYQVDQYTPFQRRRLAVRPGITGWAQIRGRNTLGWPQRIELDVWYVEHCSLRLDLQIILRTVPMLLSPEHVYNEARGDWGEVVDPAGHAEVTPDAPAETQALERFRGHAADPRAVGHVLRDDGTRGDEGAGAEAHALHHDRAHADVRAVADGDVAAEGGAGPEVRGGADHAVVLDDRAGVDDRAVAQDGAGVDDRQREDLNAAAELRPRRHGRGGVHDRREREAGREQAGEDARAGLPVGDAADADERVLHARHAVQPGDHRHAEHLGARAIRVVVDQRDGLVRAGGADRLQQRPRVPSRAVADDRSGHARTLLRRPGAARAASCARASAQLSGRRPGYGPRAPSR